MRRPPALAAAVLAAALAAASPGAAAALEVTVTGLRSDSGLVRLALYDDAESFPDKGAGRKLAVPAEEGAVTAVFDDLPPGRYALALFHDENGDDEFEKGLFGVPREGFGFSKDAPVIFGAPDFEDAAVTVDGETTAITVRMRYWQKKKPESGDWPAAGGAPSTR